MSSVSGCRQFYFSRKNQKVIERTESSHDNTCGGPRGNRMSSPTPAPQLHTVSKGTFCISGRLQHAAPGSYSSPHRRIVHNTCGAGLHCAAGNREHLEREPGEPYSFPPSSLSQESLYTRSIASLTGTRFRLGYRYKHWNKAKEEGRLLT